MSSDCVGEWLWSCHNRVGTSSQWGLQLLWGKQDDAADWPTASNQRGYRHEKHLSSGAWGQGPRDEEYLGAVTKVVPYIFLLAVWEGHDECHGQLAGTSFGWYHQAPQHLHQCGVEVILPLMLLPRQKYWNYHHLPLGGALKDGDHAWHIPGICWHDHTENPRPWLRMQSKVSQRVCRVFSYPFGRVTMVLGPLHWDARSSHGISVGGQSNHPKNWCMG